MHVSNQRDESAHTVYTNTLLFLSLTRYESETFVCMPLCHFIDSINYILKNTIYSVPR